ncbi:MAG: hypothetical protein EOO65_04180 [Methanosarcinales archaeon]|nr:MAG: hypothetical protein EOO65_04180 [Methanosarcinales archaeon]
MPFGPDLRQLGQTCHQIRQETAYLPFKTFIWAFETAFTLDQWVSMKDSIPLEHKNAIRTVAVPTPGPYRASERVLLRLDEVHLIGKAYATTTYFDQPADEEDSVHAIITLRKDTTTNTWSRSGEFAQYAKDLFE